jgi:hypothetical protein
VGQSPPQVRFRLAQGSDAPSSGTPPRSGVGHPLERDSASLGDWTPPWREVPSRSRAERPPRANFCLTRGYHGPAASIPAPPAGAFNALTFIGVQVKGESAPLRAWESCPGTAPPTPAERPSPPLCDTMRHGQQQPRGTVPPTPVRPTRPTLEKGRRSPRREDKQLRHGSARTTS